MTLSPELIRLIASLAIAAPMIVVACVFLARMEEKNDRNRS